MTFDIIYIKCHVPYLTGSGGLLASTIGEEVSTGSYRGYVVWDFIPGRSYQGKQARYRQLMTEPRSTLARYGEVLVLEQDECGLCSR